MAVWFQYSTASSPTRQAWALPENFRPAQRSRPSTDQPASARGGFPRATTTTDFAPTWPGRSLPNGRRWSSVDRWEAAAGGRAEAPSASPPTRRPRPAAPWPPRGPAAARTRIGRRRRECSLAAGPDGSIAYRRCAGRPLSDCGTAGSTRTDGRRRRAGSIGCRRPNCCCNCQGRMPIAGPFGG